MNINSENYEAYFVSYIDGELSEKEREEVEVFLSQNPHLQEELHAFESTVLIPDEDIVFTGKDLLRRSEAMEVSRKANIFPLFRLNLYSISAAAIVLFAVAFAFWNIEMDKGSSGDKLTGNLTNPTQTEDLVEISDIETPLAQINEEHVTERENDVAKTVKSVKRNENTLAVTSDKVMDKITVEPLMLVELNGVILELPEPELPMLALAQAIEEKEGVSQNEANEVVALRFNRQTGLFIKKSKEADNWLSFTFQSSAVKFSGNVPALY